MNSVFIIILLFVLIFLMLSSLLSFRNERVQNFFSISILLLSFLLGMLNVIELRRILILVLIILFYELAFIVPRIRIYEFKKETVFYISILIFQFLIFTLFYPFLEISSVFMLSLLYLLIFFQPYHAKKYTNFQLINLLIILLIFFYLISKDLVSISQISQIRDIIISISLSVLSSFLFSSIVVNYRKKHLIFVFFINIILLIVLAKILKFNLEFTLFLFLIFSLQNKKLNKLLVFGNHLKYLINPFFFFVIGLSLGSIVMLLKDYLDLTFYLFLLTLWYFLFTFLIYVVLLPKSHLKSFSEVLFYHEKYVYVFAIYLLLTGIISEKAYFLCVVGLFYIFLLRKLLLFIFKVRNKFIT